LVPEYHVDYPAWLFLSLVIVIIPSLVGVKSLLKLSMCKTYPRPVE
jgi:hypothetical protein